MTEARAQMDRTKDAPIDSTATRPATMAADPNRGRTTNTMTRNEIRGRNRISQLAASGIIYIFLRISSAMCSRPLGT